MRELAQHTLENGLRVLIREVHTTPLVAVSIWYRVGVRYELPGWTGASHFVEHLLFKGTRKYTETDLDRLISRCGGTSNAMTWLDCTVYYATVPADQLALALDIEADRMAHARFSARDAAHERRVILNERQDSENDPWFRLMEEVLGAAFHVHPYGHDAIGHSTDLQRLSYDDLRMWYRRFYTPSNAVLTIVGDVQTDQALRLVGRMFGRITSRASAAVPSLSIPSEPTQRGERRVVVHGEGQTHYLAMLFRAPPATHPDFMPLVALDAVLCGASGLSLFGGGSSNRSSRLSRLLVDTGLLASINGGVLPTRDPYLYGFYATLMPGHTLEEAEARLWEVIARVQREGVSADELEKAIKQTRAQVVLGTESASQQAFWLGFSEIIADHRWFTSFAQRLARVTLADVQRVAQRYLVRHNATIGWFVAQGAP